MWLESISYRYIHSKNEKLRKSKNKTTPKQQTPWPGSYVFFFETIDKINKVNVR